jgi:hypothetical protein
MDMKAVINRQRFALAITRVLDRALFFIDGVDLTAVEISVHFRLLTDLWEDPARLLPRQANPAAQILHSYPVS